MDSDSMNRQDEGRIDPFDTPEAIRQREAFAADAADISEFARLENERDNLIMQGVDPAELDDIIENGALVFEDVDPAEYPSAEHAALAAENPDVDPAEFQTGGPVSQVPGWPTPPPFIAPNLNTKDTNPKDGVGSSKPSYSNVPIPVLYELGAAMFEGSRKYGGYNWRVAGVRVSVYIDATRRHLDSFMEGEDIDLDSGLSHITKAIASLTVLRDAQINDMVQNDDRPPSAAVPFMAEGQERMIEVLKRYPAAVANYTQAELQHMRNTPVRVFAGNALGFELEVMLPADASDNGYIWTQQGPRRTDLNLTLAVAQALKDDGYGQRVLRVTRVSDRIEEMENGDQYVSGELRTAVATVFPGDASLMEADEEEIPLEDRTIADDPVGEGNH